ncbi:MAG TPA: arylsulfatase, partial [Gemmataceae bacterium]
PNIVYVLCDDLGYGDLKCLNPDGKIPTPNFDRVAKAGMAFTDAHSGSAVCTPTRYGILTGRYSWRSRMKSGVLQGYSPRLIEPGRLTVPALLKQHGYRTAGFGKWHLGMDWPLKGGGIAKGYDDQWKVDYTKPIANGPTAVGFDEYFGISASLDMPPYVFIHNDRVASLPTADRTWSKRGQVTGGVGSSRTPLKPGDAGAIRLGPTAADFDAVEVLPTLTRKAVEYIAAAKPGEPFFLYLPLNAPHTPILPTTDWLGKSGLNDYGDFVMQVDDTVGKVLDALDRAGLAGNTLVIFTSDNGCSPSANFPQLADKGHHPSYHFRGYKADIYDGGHHIPFVARWPGHVKPGTTSDQLTCLTDLMATAADIVGTKLPDTAGEDSVSILPALEGRATGPLREAVVHHSANGSFAIRQGKWKLELCPGSGGWSPPRPGRDDQSKLPPVQLYDMTADVGERANVQDQHPDVVARLTRLVERYAAEGRSTPGRPQKNTGEVDVWKAGREAQKPLKRAADK